MMVYNLLQSSSKKQIPPQTLHTIMPPSSNAQDESSQFLFLSDSSKILQQESPLKEVVPKFVQSTESNCLREIRDSRENMMSSPKDSSKANKVVTYTKNSTKIKTDKENLYSMLFRNDEESGAESSKEVKQRDSSHNYSSDINALEISGNSWQLRSQSQQSIDDERKREMKKEKLRKLVAKKHTSFLEIIHTKVILPLKDEIHWLRLKN